MLGQTVHSYLDFQDHDVYVTSRKEFNYKANNKLTRFDVINDEISTLCLKERNYDYIVNCIGIIRHQITDSLESTNRAIRVNSLFPLELLNEIEGSATKLIQIGTDCVFSGVTGSYSEDSFKDPVDSYGYSKAMGEVFSQNQMILRCSIIGREIDNHLSLMEWFLKQSMNSKVHGFINHKWNGLTTLAFAKILNGVISRDSFEAGTFHVVPGDQVTKFELLQTLASTFFRSDLNVVPVEASIPVDRTLITKFTDKNERLWECTKYLHIPTIEDMLREYETYTRELPSK